MNGHSNRLEWMANPVNDYLALAPARVLDTTVVWSMSIQ